MVVTQETTVYCYITMYDLYVHASKMETLDGFRQKTHKLLCYCIMCACARIH